MAYPTYKQLRGSVFYPLDRPDVFEHLTGEAKTYTTYTEKPGVFELRHRLSGSQLEALEDDYDTNRAASFSFTWDEDGGSYLVYYDSPPVSQRIAVDLFDVSVRLRKAT